MPKARFRKLRGLGNEVPDGCREGRATVPGHQMVAAGLGIAVLPGAAVQLLAKALGLRKLELTDDWVDRELLLDARDLSALPRPARSLLDQFEDQRRTAQRRPG